MSFKFGQIRPWTVELAALERLKKSFNYLRSSQVSNRCLFGHLFLDGVSISVFRNTFTHGSATQYRSGAECSLAS